MFQTTLFIFIMHVRIRHQNSESLMIPGSLKYWYELQELINLFHNFILFMTESFTFTCLVHIFVLNAWYKSFPFYPLFEARSIYIYIFRLRDLKTDIFQSIMTPIEILLNFSSVKKLIMCKKESIFL